VFAEISRLEHGVLRVLWLCWALTLRHLSC